MVSFLLVGFLGTCLVWTFEHFRRRWYALLAIVVVAASVVIIASISMSALTLLGAESWYDRQPWEDVVLFVMMILGMAARYVTKEIEDRRRRIDELRRAGDPSKPGLQFDSWEFAYPLFFSVVTFGALLGQLQNSAISLANMILSFQTGFFWQTLLKRNYER